MAIHSLLNSLKTQSDIAQRNLAYRLGIRDQLEKSIAENQSRVTEIDGLQELYTKTLNLIRHASEFSRGQVATVFEKSVTEALQTILENSTLEFKIQFIQKKNITDVSFRLHDTVLDRDLDIMKSFGGGVKDVIATILRIMVAELHKPKVQGPIILDEVGKNISQEYQENYGTFLQTLSNRLNRQIILVTHSPTIASSADQIIEITKNGNGVAQVNGTV